MDTTALADLQIILDKLYPDDESLRSVMADARIDATRVDPDAAAKIGRPS